MLQFFLEKPLSLPLSLSLYLVYNRQYGGGKTHVHGFPNFGGKRQVRSLPSIDTNKDEEKENPK